MFSILHLHEAKKTHQNRCCSMFLQQRAEMSWRFHVRPSGTFWVAFTVSGRFLDGLKLNNSEQNPFPI